MKTFDYVLAPDEATARAKAGPGTRYLAGGTNLVDLMKLGVEVPDVLVDITALPLGGIEDGPAGGLRLGATARNSDVAAHPLVRERFPAVSEAIASGASGQVRNMATVGGNLLQRTRCAYFQDVGKPCNKRAPGTGCPARAGEHRNLAILGASEHCIATHPSDLAVALAAFDAAVHVHGPGGAREIPLADFYRTPGDTPHVETVLEDAGLIVAVDLPALPFATNSTYRKVRDRASFAFAIASVAAALAVVDGVVADVRIALGAVAPMPWRARTAEDVLRGGPATPAAFREAAEAELAAAEPLEHNAFKIPLMRNVIVSTLSELA